MTTTSLPTMFGRYTAILSDHQHLGEALRRLGDLCVALESDADASFSGSEPARVIEDFARELAEHFAAEQADAYFGTMGRERPELASAIADLELEHTTMLETLRELTAAARDQSRWRAVARGMRRLVEQLRAHEHRETQVMQRFVLREEGTGAD